MLRNITFLQQNTNKMVLGGFFSTPNSLSNASHSSTSKNLAMPIRNVHNNRSRNPHPADNKKDLKLKGLLNDYLLEKGIILPKNIDSQSKTGVSNLG